MKYFHDKCFLELVTFNYNLYFSPINAFCRTPTEQFVQPNVEDGI